MRSVIAAIRTPTRRARNARLTGSQSFPATGSARRCARSRSGFSTELEGGEEGAHFGPAFPWGSRPLPRHRADAARRWRSRRWRAFDAILFGAVGSREVPDHVTLWGLRLAIVQGFDLGGQPASGAAAARDPRAAGRPRPATTSTSWWCARTPRASTRASAASPGEACRARSRVQTTIYSHAGHRAHGPLRVRARPHAARPAPARASPSPTRARTRASSGTRSSPRWPRTTPTCSWDSALVDAAAARLVLAPAGVRRHRRLQPPRRHPV